MCRLFNIWRPALAFHEISKSFYTPPLSTLFYSFHQNEINNFVKVPIQFSCTQILGTLIRVQLIKPILFENHFSSGSKEPKFWVLFGVRPKCLGLFVPYRCPINSFSMNMFISKSLHKPYSLDTDSLACMVPTVL